MSDAPEAIKICYKNWRGEVADRAIRPLRIWWGRTEWHPTSQWLLEAVDVEKGAVRDFALADMVFHTASPEAFAALEPVQALIAGAAKCLPPNMAVLQKWRDADHADAITLTRNDVISLIEERRALTPTDALAALAAREAAAERRGWLAGMGWAAGMVDALAAERRSDANLWAASKMLQIVDRALRYAETADYIAAAIRAEMEKEG